MRFIKMSQLQLCVYNLFHLPLCFGEGKDIGSDGLPGYGMNLLLLAYTHRRHFIHCLIFSLLRSLEKLLLTQVVLDQALRALINVIKSLSTVKKGSKHELQRSELLLSVKKMSTSNLFKSGNVSATNNN